VNAAWPRLLFDEEIGPISLDRIRPISWVMNARAAGRLPLWAVCAALAAGLTPAAAARPPNEQSPTRVERAPETPGHVRQQRTGHFNVSFEGAEQLSLSFSVLEALEAAYWRIGGTLGRPSAPIPVVLYTSAQFHDITRSPSWAAGAFDGIIRIPIRGALDDRRELERVLSHEYTHALIRQLCPRPVPVWLNEGLAGALESDNLEWARERVRRAGKAMPLNTLERPFRSLTQEQAALAYASSALAADRLLNDAGGVAIVNLLRDVGQGLEFGPAFASRIRRTVGEFQDELNTAP